MAGGVDHERRFPKWAVVAVAALMVVLITLRVVATHAEPFLRARAIDMLSSRFHSQVEIHEFHISLFPVSLSGSGIVLRHHGRTDVPPLLQIAKFSASANLLEVFESPWHLRRVRLQGLSLQFPPKEQRGQILGSFSKHDIRVRIDELISEDSELQILPSNPEKLPHQFPIHHLTMRHIQPGRPASFVATLTNAAPPGEIHCEGEFGPWQPDDPRATPVSATYTFSNADLSVFRGIAGILSSQGKFDGPLDDLQVEGETTTPDFTVTSGGHPMMLKTEFNATVDGTSGDTLLHPVIAHLLGSTLVSNGGVVKAAGGKGREVVLDVTAKNARIQDLLRLAVKGDKPPIIGTVNLKTKFDLPPAAAEGGEVVDRLRLNGEIGIGAMAFTDPGVRQKVESLSVRAQGRPKDDVTDDPLSRLRGSFELQNGIIQFRKLGFSVAGADVQLAGTYDLRGEDLDFHGKVQLQAKPSQMVTGFKSVLLKPFDRFFRKNGVTQLPIKVTGKRSQPSFGLDFHRKKDEPGKAPQRSSYYSRKSETRDSQETHSRQ
jgi:hypothetical protein